MENNVIISHWGNNVPYEVILDALQDEYTTEAEKNAFKERFDKTYTAKFLKDFGVDSPGPADIYMMLEMEEKDGLKGFVNAFVDIYPYWISDKNYDRLKKLFEKE